MNAAEGPEPATPARPRRGPPAGLSRGGAIFVIVVGLAALALGVVGGAPSVLDILEGTARTSSVLMLLVYLAAAVIGLFLVRWGLRNLAPRSDR